MREELVAKRYLCAKIAGPLILEYYLLVSPLAEELEIYGVKIVERRSGVAAIAPGLTTSGRKILHLIDLLSKGTVTPTSLADIVEDSVEDFQPVLRKTRKPGTGCISQINDHLFEGRYSPTWPDGTKHSKCVYAHTQEECEAKLKVLIQQMNAERQALRDKMRGITPPDKLTKTQKKIWLFMKFHPDVTSYRAIARGAGVTRHTAAKWYEMMRGMLGRAA